MKQYIPLIYFGIAILIFEIMNWYGTKYVSQTWIDISKYAFYTLPFQMIAYIFLIMGLNLGYTTFNDIWMLIISTTTISWSIKLITSYIFFQKIPSHGKIVALTLMILANIIDKLWK